MSHCGKLEGKSKFGREFSEFAPFTARLLDREQYRRLHWITGRPRAMKTGPKSRACPAPERRIAGPAKSAGTTTGRAATEGRSRVNEPEDQGRLARQRSGSARSTSTVQRLSRSFAAHARQSQPGMDHRDRRHGSPSRHGSPDTGRPPPRSMRPGL